MRRLVTIWRTYEEVYSALYEWNMRRWHGDDYMASWMTACGLAGAVCMNLVLAGGIAVALHGPLPPWPALALGAVIFLGNYAAFIWNDRYQEVVERFQRRPAQVQRRITVLGWVYIVVSFMLPMVLFLTMHWFDVVVQV